jgi:hypothetical protein
MQGGVIVLAVTIVASGNASHRASSSPTSPRTEASENATRIEIRPTVELLREQLDRLSRTSYYYASRLVTTYLEYKDLLEKAACVMGKLEVQQQSQPNAAYALNQVGLPTGYYQRYDVNAVYNNLVTNANQTYNPQQTFANLVDAYCHLVGG